MTELKNTEAGLALTAPGSWEQAEPDDNVILVARASGADGGVAATVVVSSSSLGTLALQDWVRGTSELLGSRLTGYLVLDVSSGQLAGRIAAVILGTYVDERGAELTAQQWLAIERGNGLTLTITCGTEDFPRFRATAEEIATSLTWKKA
ncbi:MAG: hypothetical protein ACOH1Y_00190 [Propionicimonas sp.]